MQKNPKHTTPEVKEAYDALDNKAKKLSPSYTAHLFVSTSS
jgi:hypothetical protein